MHPFVFALDDTVMSESDVVSLEEVSDEYTLSDTHNDGSQTLTNEEETLSNLPYKQPISKRKLLKKFLLAMFLVGLSPVIIYFGVLMYKSVNKSANIQVKTLEGDTPLSAPTNIESATKVFLEKTDWK